MPRRSIDAVLVSAGVLCCLGIALVHIDDQGGFAAFTDPDWLGWSYRVIEIAAVVIAAALLAGRATRITWTLALLVGSGPFVGYVLSRTVGIPQDRDDIGNWSDPLGVASLVIEGLLIVLAGIALSARAGHRASSAGPRVSRSVSTS